MPNSLSELRSENQMTFFVKYKNVKVENGSKKNEVPSSLRSGHALCCMSHPALPLLCIQLPCLPVKAKLPHKKSIERTRMTVQ